ncbi:hypothetical protein [Cronobacter sakazakii]|uniref:hypothetical protein n=1 Tax=Cronobacter sakazakii TaxID=28141 RepID=UPI000BE7D9A0|nr:hypothetical protein [Cronobacter sakazakii]ELY6402204.1 hypothetical protein [Cronobacter sakazakii]PUV29859.1 hypothetical protein CDT98_14525 [Cronobacter sakazakii]
MKYSRDDLIQEIQKIDDVVVRNSPLDKKDGGIVFDWKNATFLLLPRNKNKESNPLYASQKLDGEFSLNYVYRPLDTLPLISTIDKLRIANYLTANSQNICSVIYRESADSFVISAKYNPIIENLAAFKSMESLKNNNIRYIIISLMSMCLFMSADLANLITEYTKDSELQIELLKGF